MFKWSHFSFREKLFSLILLSGFLVKYNFLLFRIFYVPSITGAILRNISFIVFFVFLVFPLVKRRKNRRILYTLFFLYTVIFMANYWYNSYFGNYLSLSDMIMGQGTGRFSIIEVLIRHILRPVDLLFLLDMVLLTVLFWRQDEDSEGSAKESVSRQARDVDKEETDFGVWLMPRRSFQILLILVLLFTQIFLTNSLLGAPNPRELYREGTSYFVNVYGLVPLYLTEGLGYVVPDSFISETAVPPYSARELDGEQLVPENTNIIVIQWESLDEKMVDYKYKDFEITPFVNQMRQESLYFNNFYAQHVNGSFDADLSFLTSLYPVNRNYSYRENDLSQFDSLVKQLQQKGYQTLAFHGNDRDFFHRDQAFSELGFERFYALDDYSLEDCILEVEKTTLGINDYDFFKQSLDFLEQAEEPFFGFFITVTSHTPFDFYPPEEKREEFTDIENRLVEDFYHSLSFTDLSLEMFVEELENRGLMDDTLLVIYSDHESALEEEEYTSFRNFNLERNVKRPHHIPLLIYHPELEPGIVEKTGTITDLAPTLLDLLGEESLPSEFAGFSLLQEEQRPVLFLHETPQVLYQDQLFVFEQGEFEQIGFLDSTGKKDVNIGKEDEEFVLQTIRFMRNTVFSRRRDD